MFWKNKKTAMIAGCGKLGAEIAESLSDQNYHVLVLDIREEAFVKMEMNENLHCVIGDASDSNLLETCGLSHTDCFIAVTGNDNLNCMLVQIASQIYKVKENYVRLNDDQQRVLLEDSIQVICPKQLTFHEFKRLQGTLAL